MPSKKLVALLGAFSKADLSRFNKFLYSPYFNENEEVKKLFGVIELHFRGKTPKQLNIMDKVQVWRRIFRQKSFNDAYLRKLCYELGRLANSFLLLESQKKQKLDSEVELLGIYNERQLFQHFDSLSKKIDHGEVQEATGIDYYYHRYRYELLNHIKLEQSVGKFKSLDNLKCFNLYFN